MPRITVNGIDHNYRLEGPEGAPVLTLAHAQGFTLESWAAQIAHFSDRCRVFAPDLRGHGGTAVAGTPYRIEDLALDIVALLDALRIERMHYAGASLGGMAGFALALDHAERLRSVSFVTTQGILPQASIDGQRAATEVMRREGIEARAIGKIGQTATPNCAASSRPTRSKATPRPVRRFSRWISILVSAISTCRRW